MPSIPTTMRALHVTERGLALAHDYLAPKIRDGEALVHVHLSGICATDLQLLAGYKGDYRGVLGHEFVGKVVDIGSSEPDAKAWIGRRVVGEINFGCEDCCLCNRGLGKHCYQRRSMGIINWDGAFADYVALPIANLHAVPDELSDEEAVFTEPVAAALEILEQVCIRPSRRVYLIGDGRLGLLIGQVLAATKCDLTVIGRHPDKLAILAQQGIKTFVSSASTLTTLRQAQADIVIEATGSDGGFMTALDLVRPMGTIVLKSTFAHNLTNFDLSKLVVQEITLIGSRCGPFDAALRTLEKRKIDVAPLVVATYGLDEAVQAFAHAGQKGVLKILISP